MVSTLGLMGVLSGRPLRVALNMLSSLLARLSTSCCDNILAARTMTTVIENRTQPCICGSR